jgi:ubiquinone biosynthesis protein
MDSPSSNGRRTTPVQRPFLSLNGHESSHPRIKPRVVNSKVPDRVRKAVADAAARQATGVAPRHVTVKVGDDWAGAGHRATLNLPDEFLDDPSINEATDEVIRPLPRRKQAAFSANSEKSYAPAEWQFASMPHISWLAVLRRMGVWFQAILMFQFGNWYDVLRHRDSIDRRAVRLRETFERVGGTFVKLGQQMSSRLDILPRRYCEELASMLDRYPPFPTQEAVALIERSTGKKLDDIFSAFDPEPIGSASIACVYQAVLRQTGQKVAVKVRRPNIRALFEADFRVLDLFCLVAEALTIVPPNYTLNVRTEFRSSLTSELDFRREGRLGELFRRRALKTKEHRFTAPYVYGEYSSEEMLVQEFVSGMWLWEIFNTMDRKDAAGLARMRELNLDPKVIARHLLHAHNWSMYSHIAFHADPHPANIVVRANNELVFIDFGASGHMSPKRKRLYRRTYETFIKEDAATMAQNALMLIEPLPPMDVNAVAKELEISFTSHIMAIKSNQTRVV